MDGDYDDNFYFNNPVDYVPNLTDPWYLEQPGSVRHPAGDRQRPVRGRGPSYQLSGRPVARAGSRTPSTTGAPMGGHDWPYWKRQLDEYFSQMY